MNKSHESQISNAQLDHSQWSVIEHFRRDLCSQFSNLGLIKALWQGGARAHVHTFKTKNYYESLFALMGQFVSTSLYRGTRPFCVFN